MSEYLNKNWAILAEPVQLLLRKETDIADPYTKVKELVRGKLLTWPDYNQWIHTLPASWEVKKKLLDLTPSGYVGLAEELTRTLVAEVRTSLAA